ncbi:hypothetical protein BS50DRAFT_570139 [Corynespora cassiicola Philippines]|uniref:F-box domain-containing protein n=1 Tax=Corynespora cassiicola Philippines TaxID=1448308 RepID=A0A2T2NYV7_CORCC|nr:hypothetical protein BS50DRAFT_570139 [Corynespora cassiicola Philippines]
MAAASPLLSLPAELRNRIYHFYFSQPSTEAPPPISRSPLALPSTCRQLHRETRSLALPATTFKARCWRLFELQDRFRRVPPTILPKIRRLELALPIYAFQQQFNALQGLRLADAGVTEVEELFIQYEGRVVSEQLETSIIYRLEVVLWMTVATCHNERLSKIRIAHGGALRDHDIVQLFSRMSKLPLPFASTETWTTHPELEQGRFYLVKTGIRGEEQRRVLVLFGHTVREAEEYAKVKNQLSEGGILENVLARRPDINDAVELDHESLAYEIEQLSRSFRVELDSLAYF